MPQILILLTFLFGHQAPDPVKWTFFSKKINADSVEIHLRAKIAKGWHMYSQYNPGGPGPSSVRFEKNKMLKVVGDVKEIGKLERKYEKLFDANVTEFSSSVEFVQILKRKNEGPATIVGVVKYIVCNGKVCLPPKEVTFSVNVDHD